MLKTIIKRDGTTEDFDPSKLNKWAEWSSEEVRNRVNWSSLVMKTVKTCGESISSQDLNAALMKSCIRKKSWPYSLMAGRLYNAILRKKMFGDIIPSVFDMHSNLIKEGYMVDMGYTQEEYAQIESFVDHSKDMHMSFPQVKQLSKKYSLANRIKGTENQFETPQFVFIRMAMALAQDEPKESKISEVKGFYDEFSGCVVNAPTPNYLNLGTSHNGYASCCLYAVTDSAKSLAIGDFIANTMTYMSSGIGAYIDTRSIGDPVRGGTTEHLGKYFYYESQASSVKANTQGGRGGACTTYFNIFDPEIEFLLMLQNPMTPVDKQNRKIHFGAMFNKLFAKKVLQNKDIFTFTSYTAPDLHEALFSGDTQAFEDLYNKYDNDSSFQKKYISAREIVYRLYRQRHEVATLYTLQIDEMNRHTPFKPTEVIRSSNLCAEIGLPTEAYLDMMDLLKAEDASYITFKSTGGDEVMIKGEELVQTQRGILQSLYLQKGDSIKNAVTVEEVLTVKRQPEVALCSLGGIVITNIPEGDDEAYFRAAYRALKMADKCIHMSHYELPHVGYTAKNRLSVGVGMIGLALHLARKGLKYDTLEGRNEIHRVSERHAYFLIKASLQLGKELGNAPWIHKTKWPDGWLPIDTYKKTVDELVTVGLKYDWEVLRAEIIANNGIRNSTLIAHMPTESSSKATGAPNSIYPIRDLSLKKSDATNMLDWVATDNDILEDQYQPAWDIRTPDLLKCYAVVQKFTDQGISADTYTDRVKNPIVTTEDIIEEFTTMIKYGNKSQYYQNSYTTEKQDLQTMRRETILTTVAVEVNVEPEGTDHVAEANDMLDAAVNDSAQSTVGCESGVCTL